MSTLELQQDDDACISRMHVKEGPRVLIDSKTKFRLYVERHVLGIVEVSLGIKNRESTEDKEDRIYFSDRLPLKLIVGEVIPMNFQLYSTETGILREHLVVQSLEEATLNVFAVLFARRIELEIKNLVTGELTFILRMGQSSTRVDVPINRLSRCITIEEARLTA